MSNARSSKKTRGKRLSDEQKGPRTKRRSGMDEPSLNISLDSSLEFRMNNIYDESDDDDDDAPGSNSIFDIAASLFLNIFIGNVPLVQYLMARDLAPEVLILNLHILFFFFFFCFFHILLCPTLTYLPARGLAPGGLHLNILKLFSAMFAAEASSHTPLYSIIALDACLTKTDYLALINIVFYCMPVQNALFDRD